MTRVRKLTRKITQQKNTEENVMTGVNNVHNENAFLTSVHEYIRSFS